MSTAATSPSRPAPSTLRMTGSAEKHSLAPAPPPSAPDTGFTVDAGVSRADALAEFRHGMTSGR